MSAQYIITDWASNVLQHNGKFNFSAYGADCGVPMLFDSFDGGWDWIFENIKKEENQDELYVTEVMIK